jgi:formate hydrogenlyase subunit 4
MCFLVFFFFFVPFLAAGLTSVAKVAVDLRRGPPVLSLLTDT